MDLNEDLGNAIQHGSEELDLSSIMSLESGGDTWCAKCQQLQSELDKVKSDQLLNYKALKEKIIPTDMLIKKYGQKCKEHDNQAKKMQENVDQLQKLQRNCDALSAQLKSNLEEMEPLRKLKDKVESEKNSNSKIIRDLQDQIMAFKSLQQQQTLALKEFEAKNRHLTASAKELEASNKVWESKLKKLQDDADNRKTEMQEQKKRNTKVQQQKTRLQTWVERYEKTLKKHGLGHTVRRRVPATCGDEEGTSAMPTTISKQEIKRETVAVAEPDFMSSSDHDPDDADDNVSEAGLELENIFAEMCGSTRRFGDLLKPLSPAVSPLPASPICMVQWQASGSSGEEFEEDDYDVSISEMDKRLVSELTKKSPAINLKKQANKSQRFQTKNKAQQMFKNVKKNLVPKGLLKQPTEEDPDCDSGLAELPFQKFVRARSDSKKRSFCKSLSGGFSVSGDLDISSSSEDENVPLVEKSDLSRIRRSPRLKLLPHQKLIDSTSPPHSPIMSPKIHPQSNARETTSDGFLIPAIPQKSPIRWLRTGGMPGRRITRSLSSPAGITPPSPPSRARESTPSQRQSDAIESTNPQIKSEYKKIEHRESIGSSIPKESDIQHKLDEKQIQTVEEVSVSPPQRITRAMLRRISESSESSDGEKGEASKSGPGTATRLKQSNSESSDGEKVEASISDSVSPAAATRSKRSNSESSDGEKVKASKSDNVSPASATRLKRGNSESSDGEKIKAEKSDSVSPAAASRLTRSNSAKRITRSFPVDDDEIIFGESLTNLDEHKVKELRKQSTGSFDISEECHNNRENVECNGKVGDPSCAEEQNKEYSDICHSSSVNKFVPITDNNAKSNDVFSAMETAHHSIDSGEVIKDSSTSPAVSVENIKTDKDESMPISHHKTTNHSDRKCPVDGELVENCLCPKETDKGVPNQVVLIGTNFVDETTAELCSTGHNTADNEDGKYSTEITLQNRPKSLELHSIFSPDTSDVEDLTSVPTDLNSVDLKYDSSPLNLCMTDSQTEGTDDDIVLTTDRNMTNQLENSCVEISQSNSRLLHAENVCENENTDTLLSCRQPSVNSELGNISSESTDNLSDLVDYDEEVDHYMSADELSKLKEKETIIYGEQSSNVNHKEYDNVTSGIETETNAASESKNILSRGNSSEETSQDSVRVEEVVSSFINQDEAKVSSTLRNEVKSEAGLLLSESCLPEGEAAVIDSPGSPTPNTTSATAITCIVTSPVSGVIASPASDNSPALDVLASPNSDVLASPTSDVIASSASDVISSPSSDIITSDVMTSPVSDMASTTMSEIFAMSPMCMFDDWINPVSPLPPSPIVKRVPAYCEPLEPQSEEKMQTNYAEIKSHAEERKVDETIAHNKLSEVYSTKTDSVCKSSTQKSAIVILTQNSPSQDATQPELMKVVSSLTEPTEIQSAKKISQDKSLSSLTNKTDTQSKEEKKPPEEINSPPPDISLLQKSPQITSHPLPDALKIKATCKSLSSVNAKVCDKLPTEQKHVVIDDSPSSPDREPQSDPTSCLRSVGSKLGQRLRRCSNVDKTLVAQNTVLSENSQHSVSEHKVNVTSHAENNSSVHCVDVRPRRASQSAIIGKFDGHVEEKPLIGALPKEHVNTRLVKSTHGGHLPLAIRSNVSRQLTAMSPMEKMKRATGIVKGKLTRSKVKFSPGTSVFALGRAPVPSNQAVPPSNKLSNQSVSQSNKLPNPVVVPQSNKMVYGKQQMVPCVTEQGRIVKATRKSRILKTVPEALVKSETDNSVICGNETEITHTRKRYASGQKRKSVDSQIIVPQAEHTAESSVTACKRPRGRPRKASVKNENPHQIFPVTDKRHDATPLNPMQTSSAQITNTSVIAENVKPRSLNRSARLCSTDSIGAESPISGNEQLPVAKASSLSGITRDDSPPPGGDVSTDNTALNLQMSVSPASSSSPSEPDTTMQASQPAVVKKVASASSSGAHKAAPLTKAQLNQVNAELTRELQAVFRMRTLNINMIAGRLLSIQPSITSKNLAQRMVLMLMENSIDLLSSAYTELSKATLRGPPLILAENEMRLLHLVMCLQTNPSMVLLREEILQACQSQVYSNLIVFKPASMALCRFFTVLCKHTGDVERVRVFVYHTLHRQVREAGDLVLAVAGVWPSTLTKSGTVGNSEVLLSVIEYAVMNKLLQEMSKSTLAGRCLQLLCGWGLVTSGNDMGQTLFKQLQTIALSPQVIPGQQFDVEKALELLACVEGWAWTNNMLIIELIWPTLQAWATRTGKFTSPTPAKDRFVACLLRLVGAVSMQCPPEHSSAVEEVIKMLTPIVCGLQHAVAPCIEEAIIETLVTLAPFQSEAVLKVCHQWLQKQYSRLSEVSPTTLAKLRTVFRFYKEKLHFWSNVVIDF